MGSHRSSARSVIALGIALAILSCSEIREDVPEPAVAETFPTYFAILTAEPERAAQWYESTFDLERLSDQESEDGTFRILNLAGPDFSIEIIRDPRAQAAERPLGLFKVGRRVADVDALAAHLLDRGVEDRDGGAPRVLEHKELGIRLLQIIDPDGNRLQFFDELSPSP